MDGRFLLERVAARAWPAAEAVERDGWLLRATPGVTRRRSSSALPLSPAPAAIEVVEAFFRVRGATPLVQVAPLDGLGSLDAALAERGWRASGATDVLVADAARVPAHGAAAVADGVTGAWLDAWTAIERRPDAAGHRAILSCIPSPAGFALATRGGRPAGVGLCAVEGGWGGVFCLATADGARRTGVAREVLGGLARWAAERGAAALPAGGGGERRGAGALRLVGLLPVARLPLPRGGRGVRGPTRRGPGRAARRSVAAARRPR